MFYSHNLLARKGPLGTVWCAAHLQNKLKKSNYITVNIQSTVEQIMNPQVPIALRMSGHLLLGVVRIYSKKVEYLQHDYNILRIDISKAYAYADINLPEDANQAKFDSITLPDKFALDLMDVDDYDPYGSPDTHLRRHEDISLQDHRDQIPAGYIEFSFSEDASINPTPSRNDSGSMSLPTEENHPTPITPPQTIPGFQGPDHIPNHQNQDTDTFINEDNIPTFEGLRDASHDFGSQNFTLPDQVEPDLDLVNQLSYEKNNSLPTVNDDILVTEGLISSPGQTPPLDLTHSEPVNDHSEQPFMCEVVSTSLVKSSAPAQPAPAAEQPRAKRRKIKYDKATVLSNRVMKKSLEDCSDLRRKRRGACTSLDVWRVNNSRKGEKVLFASIITGLCDNLCEIFEGDLMSKRARKICMEEAPVIHTEEAYNDNMEWEEVPEHGRDNVVIPPNSADHGAFSSPCQNDENTPAISPNMGSQSYPIQTTIGTRVESTPGPTSSIGSFASDMETPEMFFQGQQGFENSGGLSDIAEVDDAGDLAFIEDEEGTAISLKGTPQSDYSSGKQRSPPEIGSLLARTKAVAQYIKEKASATPSTPTDVGSVSMSSILEGKKRKVCSRMFYETLVLKSCDLIDVKQDEPYGDIILKVTSKLAKHQFLN